MRVTEVVSLIERVDTVRCAPKVVAEIREALAGVARLRGWLDGCEADLAAAIIGRVAAPAKEIAAAGRTSQRAADRAIERHVTGGDVPTFGEALADGAVSGGHVDVLAAGIRSLEPAERAGFRQHAAELVEQAKTSTVEEFRSLVQAEARRYSADHGESRLARQKRACRLRSWVDPADGMWRLSGRFDPESGLALHGRLAATVSRLFHQSVPDDAPDDPGERADFLRAHALLALTADAAASTPASSGGRRAEIVPVIHVKAPSPQTERSDHSEASVSSTTEAPTDSKHHPEPRCGERNSPPLTAAGARPGGDSPPHVEWGIPVELPWSVIHQLFEDGADVQPVVVCDGVVLHTPGEMNLGRSTRLASRAQRRALRAMHPTCAMPGCSVGFDHTQPHHVIWWERGGLTDLDNLLPLCSRHHHHVHDDGWQLRLTRHRVLTIVYPDGTFETTKPPGRLRHDRQAA